MLAAETGCKGLQLPLAAKIENADLTSIYTYIHTYIHDDCYFYAEESRFKNTTIK